MSAENSIEKDVLPVLVYQKHNIKNGVLYEGVAYEVPVVKLTNSYFFVKNADVLKSGFPFNSGKGKRIKDNIRFNLDVFNHLQFYEFDKNSGYELDNFYFKYPDGSLRYFTDPLEQFKTIVSIETKKAIALLENLEMLSSTVESIENYESRKNERECMYNAN